MPSLCSGISLESSNGTCSSGCNSLLCFDIVLPSGPHRSYQSQSPGEVIAGGLWCTGAGDIYRPTIQPRQQTSHTAGGVVSPRPLVASCGVDPAIFLPFLQYAPIGSERLYPSSTQSPTRKSATPQPRRSFRQSSTALLWLLKARNLVASIKLIGALSPPESLGAEIPNEPTDSSRAGARAGADFVK